MRTGEHGLPAGTELSFVMADAWPREGPARAHRRACWGGPSAERGVTGPVRSVPGA